MNGHKKPVLSGSNAEWLRERIKSGSFTLRGLTAELAAHGIKTHQKIVWLFVHAEGLSFKKLCCQRSRHALTLPANVRADPNGLMKRGSSQTWHPCAAEGHAEKDWKRASRTGTGKP